MLDTLLESRAHRARRARGAALSVVAHAAIIALAVVATGRAAAPPHVDPPQTIWLVPTPPAPPAAPSPGRPRGGTGAPTARPRTDVPPLPPIANVDGIDVTVPTLDGLQSLDDRDRFARGGLPATAIDGGAPGEGLGSGDAPLTAETVERAVLPIPDAGAPRYPEPLRATGVEGRVVARFVVDTNGRVEPGSLVVRMATDELFAAAVRAALPAMRFRPAEARGRRVRQLVEQAFEFQMKR